MATIKEIIENTKVSLEVPNSIKYRWLAELDTKQYRYPEDADTELATPNTKLYELYLIAMSDFWSGDLASYQESAREFLKEYGRMTNL